MKINEKLAQERCDNNEITIEITPFDTLFFRDGKPFSRGEESWADGMFPPSPSVIYGALRSAYFGHHIDKLKLADGDFDPTKNLKITGTCLKSLKDGFFYLPLPMDCVKKDNNVVLLSPETVNLKSNYKLDELFKSDEPVKTISNGLIDDEQFVGYLSGDIKEFIIMTTEDYLVKEPKVGIGRKNQTHTAANTMLYRVSMQRMKEISIIVSFEGLEDLPQVGLMKLGGEGKAVYYRQIDKTNIQPDISITKKFKLVLTTPAIFDSGWLPYWIDSENNYTGEFNGLELKLTSAIVGKPLSIGGFDLKAHKPKPMRKAVPSGSVYYFEIINGNSEKVIQSFQQKAISDNEKNAREGYGIVHVGGIS